VEGSSDILAMLQAAIIGQTFALLSGVSGGAQLSGYAEPDILFRSQNISRYSRCFTVL
jgi:hypothetical protein